MKKFIALPGGSLHGCLYIPSDKSITHRALILGALIACQAKIKLHNWLQSLDCQSTLCAMQAMGVKCVQLGPNILEISRVGLHGLQQPQKILDVGNSGTSMRLLTGVLAAQKFNSVITGDVSLCKRPMRRIIEPLTQMGALITGVDQQYAPLVIIGKQKLQAITYKLPIASAQVKSAILLADLYCDDDSQIIENEPCRNHTEIMLQSLRNGAEDLYIPGDISAAAFFIVGATIAAQSRLIIKNVGVNPTRTGVIAILQAMGANIRLENFKELNGEPSADIHICSAKLKGINVPLELIPNAIDELPIILIAAACADGITIIRGAKELRYKESDRISIWLKG